MTTVSDLINSSFRNLGVLADGESPSAEMAQGALESLNGMIDSWNTERLILFATETQTFTWPAGQVSRTLGPTGDFVGNRPYSLDPSTYFSYNNVDFPIKIIERLDYDSIPVKTVQSNIPDLLFVNYDFPNVTMYLYPVPSSAITFNFVSTSKLSQFNSLTETINLPPGFIRCLNFNLACEISPQYGVNPSPQVVRIAQSSKRNIKRTTQVNDIMDIPINIFRPRGQINIYTGGLY